MSVSDKVKKYILEASKKFKVEPSEVTSSQFWLTCQGIKEWDLRKLGGYKGLRDTLYPAVASEEGVKKAKLVKPKVFKKQAKKPIQNFEVHNIPVAELFKQLKLKDDEVLRVVVQPDTHAPEYDERAVGVFCNFLEYYKPHGLVNIGDYLEMESVSHWENGILKPRRLVPEIKEAKALLEVIGKAAGPQCILKRYITGNHEDWLQQYLTAKIPEVFDGLDELGTSLKFDSLLGLKGLGYEVIPLNEILKIGEAHFIHGYYTGVNHAKKHLDVFGVNLYYGHLHDVQSYSGVSVNGTHEAMSLGCLRTLNAPFMKGKPNNWSHAFGIFEFRADGTYTRYVPIIIDGEFSFNGKVFKA